MLKDVFFSIIDSTDTPNTIDFTIHLNEQHEIYQAHFYGNPITPGVCILQIAKELVVFWKQADCSIQKIKNVKFLHPNIPTIHPIVHYQMEAEDVQEGLYPIIVKVYAGDVVFSKIKMQIKKKTE
jgi:3-hydroxyacyl-[acyl-carrier-protein] dehydratase